MNPGEQVQFKTITDIPLNDLQHVPPHIRIDRLTTIAAIRRSRIKGKSSRSMLYAIWKGNTCIMIGNSDDVGAELGIHRSIVTNYASKGSLYDGEFRIRKVSDVTQE